jgi:dGTPase
VGGEKEGIRRMHELSESDLRVVRQFEDREKKILSPNAAFSKNGKRRHEEDSPNIRPSFSRDADRILHSFAFTRYIDKTQVFYLCDNDSVTHRMIHVQLLSKIGRIIARALELNEDLVEAIALGHDIGHAPFGHEGESTISREITEKLADHKFFFHHSIQSIRWLDRLEGVEYTDNGIRTLNLTLEVLDGILCHDGEDLCRTIEPNKSKSFADFDREVEMKKSQKKIDIFPMTLEGCLVRFVDVVSYIGRDMEDAIAIGLIKRNECPAVLGECNREIVNNLAMDIIKNSSQDAISYSKETFKKLQVLYKFNYDNIYMNPLIKIQKDKVSEMFLSLYHKLLEHIRDGNEASPIFKDHIDSIDRYDSKRTYFNNTPPEVVVVDYLAGMTDDYFINTFMELFLPMKLTSILDNWKDSRGSRSEG